MLLYLAILAIGLLIGCLLALKVSSTRLQALDTVWQERLDDRVSRELARREDWIRKEAAQRSGSVLSGRVLERFSPFMDQFPFDPHDAVWIGSPVDFVVFDGLSKDRNTCNALRQIIFVEIKSGSGRLSARQRNVKEIVERGRVSWKEVKVHPIA